MRCIDRRGHSGGLCIINSVPVDFRKYHHASSMASPQRLRTGMVCVSTFPPEGRGCQSANGFWPERIHIDESAATDVCTNPLASRQKSLRIAHGQRVETRTSQTFNHHPRAEMHRNRMQPFSNWSKPLTISCSHKNFHDDISNGSRVNVLTNRQTHTHTHTQRTLLKTSLCSQSANLRQGV